jgi:hypothetical protein
MYILRSPAAKEAAIIRPNATSSRLPTAPHLSASQARLPVHVGTKTDVIANECEWVSRHVHDCYYNIEDTMCIEQKDGEESCSLSFLSVRFGLCNNDPGTRRPTTALNIPWPLLNLVQCPAPHIYTHMEPIDSTRLDSTSHGRLTRMSSQLDLCTIRHDVTDWAHGWRTAFCTIPFVLITWSPHWADVLRRNP